MLLRSENTIQNRMLYAIQHCFQTKNEFERFILELIPEQLPTTFVEGFKNLYDGVENLNLPSKPKYIIGSVFLWYQTPCMLYAAKKIEQYKNSLFFC